MKFPSFRALSSSLRAVLLLLPIFFPTSTLGEAGSSADAAPASYFSRFDSEHGLSQNSVRGLVQGSDGFFWIGTLDGLNRWDGARVKIYKHRPYDRTSLSSGRIMTLIEGRDGMLWIGTDAGLNRLDPRTEEIRRYAPQSVSVTALLEDRRGRIWIGDSRGALRRLDPSTEETVSWDTQTAVRSLAEDAAGALWIGTDGGLLRLRAQDQEPAQDQKPVQDQEKSEDQNPNQAQLENLLPDRRVTAFAQDPSGFLWIGARMGLLRRDSSSGETVVVEDAEGALREITFLRLDAQRNLWIGMRGRGLIRRSIDGSLTRYRHDPEQNDSLSDDDVTALWDDAGGVLWIGTDGGGLNRLHPGGERFRHFRHRAKNPESLAVDDVMALHEDERGVLWVGTDGGGLHRRIGPDRFARLQHDESLSTSLSHDGVFALWSFSDGTVWIGTREGLNRLDPPYGTGDFTRYRSDPEDPNALRRESVRALVGDRRGTLWIGTYGGGLHRLTPPPDRSDPSRWDDAKLENYRRDPDDPTSLADDNVMSLYEDRKGVLWIGTLGGGLNRRLEGGGFQSFRHDPDDPASLSHDFVRAIHEDRLGVLWIGTYGGGLNRLDEARRTFTHFTERDGLINNVVYSILEDDDGRLWLSTNRGVTRFDPVFETWTDYDLGDGLQAEEFNSGAGFAGRDGTLYLGGIGGFNSFVPGRMAVNPNAPPVFLTDFKIFHRPVRLPRSILFTEEITLSHRDNFFTFEFAALNFERPDKNRYLYLLEGFEEEWNEPEDSPSASYTKVPPGEYVFRVRASNNDGVWNDVGASVRVRITPPWWRTWWFFAAEIFLGLLLLGALFVFQQRRLKQKQEQEMRLRDLRRKTEELEFARRLQLAMLPRRQLKTANLTVYAAMNTAGEVGGDYYDVLPIGEMSAGGVTTEAVRVMNRWCVIAADAMGHGMTSGLVVGMFKAALVQALKALGDDSEVADLVRTINLTLKESIPLKRLGLCLTAVLLDLNDRCLEICSMAMPSPYHWRAEERRLDSFDVSGFPLGLRKDLRIRSFSLRLAPGDVLILVSDGFPERRNRQEDLWGYDALEETLLAICRRETEPRAIAQRLMQACDDFAEREPVDDMTVVVIRAR